MKVYRTELAPVKPILPKSCFLLVLDSAQGGATSKIFYFGNAYLKKRFTEGGLPGIVVLGCPDLEIIAIKLECKY